MIRSSGILLHISSLPSPYGIGTLGKEAYEFIDFLSRSGQRYWQMLPLGPTSFGDSPYQSFSTYAGNPYFVDLVKFISEGLLTEDEVNEISWGRDPTRVDFCKMYMYRETILRKAFFRYRERDQSQLHDFYYRNQAWLSDYAFYMALKEHFVMRSWEEWGDQNIRLREHKAMDEYKELLKDDIEYHIFIQFMFFQQWEDLRAYGVSKGIDFIGDLPIYVSMDSSDVWASPEYFQLDEDRLPTGVGGVPPDYFSSNGQLWGNPLYNWDSMKTDDYAWWIKRIDASTKLFDIVRIDHFRGFDSYWRIPWGAATAINGEWKIGPGMDFIRRIKDRFPNHEIIAEDLGLLTKEVRDLVKASGFPGMKILQFAFDSRADSIYLPHNFTPNSVVYTGTHDNNTVGGWLRDANEAQITYATEYLKLDHEEGMNWGFIRGAMSSVSNLCIAQMQDFIDLPSSERMNTPGTVGNNWRWRLKKGQLTDDLAQRIAEMTKLYGR